MASTNKKRRNGHIDWDNMKVVFVPASSVDANPLNPAGDLSAEEREKVIISIAARILNNEVE
ncbi:MAG: hypothetical protein H6755_05920 [Candidatus Omnitrophica bacterium]|nr:hypothetical protein [Candidatus Omnitrophota bacterium]MCB9747931.1 hypothetical protein [Candidatus Omnitrophota bacterium]